MVKTEGASQAAIYIKRSYRVVHPLKRRAAATKREL